MYRFIKCISIYADVINEPFIKTYPTGSTEGVPISL